MKRLLMITPVFGCGNAIGARRCMMWAAHLPSFGWEAVILTHPAFGYTPRENSEPGSVIVRSLPYDAAGSSAAAVNRRLRGLDGVAPLAALRRLTVRALQHLLVVPDNMIYRLEDYGRAGETLCETHHCDAILATTPEAGLLLAGREIARRTGLPWIADYRDLWTSGYLATRDPIRRLREARLERAILKTAASVTAATPAFAEHLRARYGVQATGVYNGYEAESYRGEHPLDSRFSLAYVGTIIKPRQAPRIVLEACRRLADADEQFARDLSLVYVGRQPEHYLRAASQAGVESFVKSHGLVERPQAVRLTRGAQALLMSYEPAGQQGMVVAKLFDYLAAARPIVCCHGDETILSATKTGRVVASVEQAKQEIRRLYAGYRAHGAAPWDGIQTEIEAYSAESSTRALAEVLAKIT